MDQILRLVLDVVYPAALGLPINALAQAIEAVVGEARRHLAASFCLAGRRGGLPNFRSFVELNLEFFIVYFS